MTALANHFPTGCWHQPDESYAGECSCGASFAGPSYAEAKQAWADHAAAPSIAIGAGEVEMPYAERLAYEERILALEMDIERLKKGERPIYAGLTARELMGTYHPGDDA